MTDPSQGPRLGPVVGERGRVSRYRVELPKAGIVPTERNRFEATAYAERRSGLKGAYLAARDLVLGTTLASHRLESERLGKIKALAIFSSDAISSVAYATQEILFVLILAGAGAIQWSLPIAGAIVVLLTIVITSYRQTVRAYPGGGGAYIVAHENIGVSAGLLAAAALLTDYVLTVSVSTAAGIDALASLNEGIRPFAVPIAVGVVTMVALINLRGVTESASIFAVPTYAFIVLLGVAIGLAVGRILGNGENPFAAGTAREPVSAEEGLGILLILKAFASGCTALTGVEAISNGVQSFRPPAPRNARQTMVAMGTILGFLFLGLTIVARHHGFIPHEDNTIPSQLGAEAYGDGSILHGLLNVMTAGILVLAANTSFAGFPQLAAILARDGYIPRIFHARGNRLVFSYGIVLLAAISCALLIAFNATTTRLIPLYALGVFLSFTLSQAGMVRHWLKSKEQGWRAALVVNGTGALTTALVFVVILEAKFTEGAWVVCILIPLLAGLFFLVGRFYRALGRSLFVPSEAVLDLHPTGPSSIPHVVPVEDINLATVMTLGAACERSRNVTAVHVIVDPDEPSTVAQRWGRQFPHVPLVVIDSPYRTVADPIAVYVNDRLRDPPHEVTVMVPVLDVRRWWERPLVNQSLKRLARLLGHRRHVNVVRYPFDPGSARRRSASLPSP
ncbi:MAG: APC family permease [Dehalococcoidia bacterium]|nr:APC family permease [Dehalococcoidia bacterium]